MRGQEGRVGVVLVSVSSSSSFNLPSLVSFYFISSLYLSPYLTSFLSYNVPLIPPLVVLLSPFAFFNERPGLSPSPRCLLAFLSPSPYPLRKLFNYYQSDQTPTNHSSFPHMYHCFSLQPLRSHRLFCFFFLFVFFLLVRESSAQTRFACLLSGQTSFVNNQKQL